MNAARVVAFVLPTLVACVPISCMVVRRKSNVDGLMRFVAFYVNVPLLFSIGNFLLWFYFAFLGDYDSPDLTIGFVVFGVAGCMTKGLHWTATRVESRVASVLLGLLYLLTAPLFFKLVSGELNLNRGHSFRSDLDLGVMICLGLLNLLAGSVVLFALLFRRLENAPRLDGKTLSESR